MSTQKKAASAATDTPKLTDVHLTRLVDGESCRINPQNGALDELADSIKLNGVLNPIRVRSTKGKKLEIIAGHRRVAACRSLKLETVPAFVIEADPHDAAMIGVVDNFNRENLHPLEESRAIAHLFENGWEIGQIAERLGKSLAWIKRRGKLGALIEPVRKLVLDEGNPWSGIKVGVLEMLAALPAREQEIIFEENRNATTKWDLSENLDSRETLAEDIAINSQSLADASFDTAATDLVQGCVSCVDCPKRTAYEPALFDIDTGKKKGDLGQCLDFECYNSKVRAMLQAKVIEAKVKSEKDGHELVLLCNAGGSDLTKIAKQFPKATVVHEGQVMLASPKEKDVDVKRAVIVDGHGLGNERFVQIVNKNRDKAPRGGAIKAKPDDPVSSVPAVGSSAKKAAAPLSIADRKKKHDARRAAWRVNKVAEWCSELNHLTLVGDELLAIARRDVEDCNIIALAVLFGTDHADRWVSKTGHEWTQYTQACADRKGDEEMLARLFQQVLGVFADRLKVHGLADIKHKDDDARFLVETTQGVDAWQKLVDDSIEALPEPKTWAKEQAAKTKQHKKALAKAKADQKKAPTSKSKKKAKPTAKKPTAKKSTAKKAPPKKAKKGGAK